MVAILTLQDHRAVDVILPTGFLSWAEDVSGRFAPMDPVLAFNKCQALLRPPGEPHPVHAAILQHRDVKASAVLTAHDGIAFILHPPTSSLNTWGCGLRTSGFGPRTSDFGLRTSDFSLHLPQRLRSRDFFPIRQHAEPPAPVITFAGLVPKNGQPAAVVADLVQAKETPRVGHQRIDLDCVVGPRAQANQPADDEVAIGRVVVVLAALGNLDRKSTRLNSS